MFMNFVLEKETLEIFHTFWKSVYLKIVFSIYDKTTNPELFLNK